MVQNEKKLSVTLHVSGNHTSWFSFMAHMFKMTISQGYFFFFHFFKKKWPKTTKNSVSHASYFRNHTSYDCHLWSTSVNGWYIQVFFSFFQNFDFLGCCEVKVQKMAQSDKKFCLLCFISQELYIIWFSFMVHMSKMIIFFQNFGFLGF